MAHPHPRIILVTGSPRSGTTAVGDVLSFGHGVCSLHEPFNYLVGMQEVERYFEAPGADSCTPAKLDGCVESIRSLRLHLKPGVFPRERGIRRVFKRVFGGRARLSYWRCRLNPFLNTIVWKDPFACFAAARIARVHDSQVVVTLRNPLAVAASFKRMGWGFDVEDIYRRLGAMGALGPVEDSRAWRERTLPAGNAALVWYAVYSVLGRACRESERFVTVDLDEVIADPVATYAALYRRLGLPWGAGIERRIRHTYKVRQGPAVPDGQRAHGAARDLRAINAYWAEVLSEDEQRMVEELTAPVWRELGRGRAPSGYTQAPG